MPADEKAWSEVDVLAKEENSLTQLCLGMWGFPRNLKGVRVFSSGKLIVWSLTGKCLHIGMPPRTCLAEDDWRALRVSTACGRWLMRDEKLKGWFGSPVCVPQGFTPKREIPIMPLCRNCARWLVLDRRDTIALDELLLQRPETQVRFIQPIIKRTSATFAPLAELPEYRDTLAPGQPDDLTPDEDDAED